MSNERAKGTDWVCVNCGCTLGNVVAGELVVLVPPGHSITRGPHLVVTCPECAREKTFYTSDAVVRAVYQLIDAITGEFARRLVRELGTASMKMQRNEHTNTSQD
jgi:hypothetical protein